MHQACTCAWVASGWVHSDRECISRRNMRREGGASSIGFIRTHEQQAGLHSCVQLRKGVVCLALPACLVLALCVPHSTS